MWGLVAKGTFARSLSILVGLFIGVTAVFVCAGSRVGEIFSQSESLDAYSWDLAGSLTGVLAIAATSAFQTPPPVWFALSTIPLTWLSRRWWSWISMAAVLALTWLSIGGALFSPYYRIDIDRAGWITGVTTLSLLFGSTWIVNVVVFAGILLVALIANAIVRRWPIEGVRIPLVLLLFALVLNYFVGAGALLTLSVLWRGILGGVVNALPVGFAGLTFSTLFARAPEPDAALGSNLLGAVVGGCVEYLSIVVGLRAITLVALLFYLAVLLLVERKVRPAETAL